jgi:hypothetical protein
MEEEPTTVHEYVGNPHVHTLYSDGQALHAEVARAAAEAGINFVIVTDHNVWVDGCEGYYDDVLLLVGEEIHDVRLQPQANHLLVYNAEAELSPLASDMQALIDEASQWGGFCYLAHPHERDSKVGPDMAALSWTNWEITGYKGFEVWNYMSEFKGLMRSKLAAVYYAYFPSRGIKGPFKATLRKWDELLSQGQRIAAIGGADAHGDTYSLGPFKRVLFPYSYLFRCVSTHILTKHPFNGNLAHDKALVYDALRSGRTWAGYDLPASTTGFRFHARSGFSSALVGEELARAGATIFEIQTPKSADIRLLLNGEVVARNQGKRLKFTTALAGVYRVEAYRTYRMGRRGWIFSSPIYVT